MYSKILVPLDGSELSEQILPTVVLLAKALGCPVRLLRVMEPPPNEIVDSAHGLYPHRIVESERSRIEDYLSEKARGLASSTIDVSTVVYVGEAAEQIISESESDPNALIAMSTHGRSGVTRWLMGSVADKVLQGATNPLLLVRGSSLQSSPEVQLSTVIVPLDRSPTAELALPHAITLAKSLGLKIALVWAFPIVEGRYTDIGYEGTTYGVPAYGEVSQAVEEEAKRYFASIQESLEQQGITQVETHLLWGHTASTIVDLARDTPNSMLALTSHGYSGPGRWVMGSVADHLVRESGEPVLMVRAG